MSIFLRYSDSQATRRYMHEYQAFSSYD